MSAHAHTLTIDIKNKEYELEIDFIISGYPPNLKLEITNINCLNKKDNLFDKDKLSNWTKDYIEAELWASID